MRLHFIENVQLLKQRHHFIIAETFKSLHRAIDAVFADGVSLCRINQFLGQLRTRAAYVPKRVQGSNASFLHGVAFLAQVHPIGFANHPFPADQKYFSTPLSSVVRRVFRILVRRISGVELFGNTANHIWVFPIPDKVGGLFGLIRHDA